LRAREANGSIGHRASSPKSGIDDTLSEGEGEEDMTLVDDLARHWWVIALRGLAAVLFGVLAFAWPGMTLAVLVLLFGAYALIDGILAVAVAARGGTDHRWVLGLEGVVGVLAGLATFAFPGLTALVLLYIIAFWAILTGVLEVTAAVRLRRAITNEWGLIIGGVLSVVFGIVLIAAPGAGALAVVFLIGAYAVLFGVTLLTLSWRLRSHAERLPDGGPTSGRAATA
jgi:uncharacterized membrane protein HdeD (DUF308 family)